MGLKILWQISGQDVSIKKYWLIELLIILRIYWFIWEGEHSQFIWEGEGERGALKQTEMSAEPNLGLNLITKIMTWAKNESQTPDCTT